MASSNGGIQAPIVIIICLLLSTPPLYGFIEQELNEPASQMIEELEGTQESVIVGTQGALPGLEPQPRAPQIEWPPPEYGLSLLLSQNDYSSLSHVAFPFSSYVRILFGWLLDSSEDHRSYRLSHGPVAMLHLSFPNLSTLTPLVSFGPAYYFSKRFREDQSSEPHKANKESHTIGLMANVGLDLFLTGNFSLLMQQSLMMMESGIDNDAGEEVRSVSRSQIMFQFTF